MRHQIPITGDNEVTVELLAQYKGPWANTSNSFSLHNTKLVASLQIALTIDPLNQSNLQLRHMRMSSESSADDERQNKVFEDQCLNFEKSNSEHVLLENLHTYLSGVYATVQVRLLELLAKMNSQPESFKKDAALLERYLLGDKAEVHADVQIYFEDPCFSGMPRPQDLDGDQQGIK